MKKQILLSIFVQMTIGNVFGMNIYLKKLIDNRHISVLNNDPVLEKLNIIFTDLESVKNFGCDFTIINNDPFISKFLDIDMMLQVQPFFSAAQEKLIVLMDKATSVVAGLLRYHIENDSLVVIDGLAVNANFRNQGLARFLIKAFENEVKIMADIKEIPLMVNQQNISAIKLYLPEGYQI